MISHTLLIIGFLLKFSFAAFIDDGAHIKLVDEQPEISNNLERLADDDRQSTFTSWELDGLSAHNIYRNKHGSPSMTLNRKLCNWAQQWANNLADSGTFTHNSDNKYGENLYMMSSSNSVAPKVLASSAVTSWYNEIKQYNFTAGVFSAATGHFTQVVWKGSTQLGIAKASTKGKTIIVANYNPAGNMIGKFIDNVKPKIRK